MERGDEQSGLGKRRDKGSGDSSEFGSKNEGKEQTDGILGVSIVVSDTQDGDTVIQTTVVHMWNDGWIKVGSNIGPTWRLGSEMK